MSNPNNTWASHVSHNNRNNNNNDINNDINNCGFNHNNNNTDNTNNKNHNYGYNRNFNNNTHNIRMNKNNWGNNNNNNLNNSNNNWVMNNNNSNYSHKFDQNNNHNASGNKRPYNASNGPNNYNNNNTGHSSRPGTKNNTSNSINNNFNNNNNCGGNFTSNNTNNFKNDSCNYKSHNNNNFNPRPRYNNNNPNNSSRHTYDRNFHQGKELFSPHMAKDPFVGFSMLSRDQSIAIEDSFLLFRERFYQKHEESAGYSRDIGPLVKKEAILARYYHMDMEVGDGDDIDDSVMDDTVHDDQDDETVKKFGSQDNMNNMDLARENVGGNMIPVVDDGYDAYSNHADHAVYNELDETGDDAFVSLSHGGVLHSENARNSTETGINQQQGSTHCHNPPHTVINKLPVTNDPVVIFSKPLEQGNELYDLFN